MSPPPPFKAIIIGGSISGLTLGIDYILLEARDTISPQLGASIIIMPNGARILDQLGVYEEMREKIVTGMKRTWTRRGDGGALVASNEWPRVVEERLHYECGICERRNFLRSLYEQLEDKSKILLNRKVIAVEMLDEGVRVRCEDGSFFEGSIVVGADGIHSRVRKEMQRLAPRGLMDGDLKSKWVVLFSGFILALLGEGLWLQRVGVVQ
jgi:FAD dependent monooxygenase